MRGLTVFNYSKILKGLRRIAGGFNHRKMDFIFSPEGTTLFNGK